jgi:hypothetical protein
MFGIEWIWFEDGMVWNLQSGCCGTAKALLYDLRHASTTLRFALKIVFCISGSFSQLNQLLSNPERCVVAAWREINSMRFPRKCRQQ